MQETSPNIYSDQTSLKVDHVKLTVCLPAYIDDAIIYLSSTLEAPRPPPPPPLEYEQLMKVQTHFCLWYRSAFADVLVVVNFFH